MKKMSQLTVWMFALAFACAADGEVIRVGDGGSTPEFVQGTWPAGSVVEVVGDIAVGEGMNLTIQPGTILKFATGTALSVASGGRLSAIGSRAAPIIFTSMRDDEHGGDSNNDGDSTIPRPGDWVKISTVSGAEAIFRHCQILYASRNAATGAINMDGGTVEFTDSLIAHGLYDAVGVESGSFYMTNSAIWDCRIAFRNWPYDPIVNSVIYDCGRLTQGGGQQFVNCIFSKITDAWEAFAFPGSTYANCVFWNESGSVLTGDDRQDAMNVCGQNGNLWGNPQFVDPEHGDFRIFSDSPCVDAANSLVAPATDHFGQPRFTIANSAQAGISDADDIYADIGLYEVQPDNDTSGHDLSAVAVSAVGDILPGNPLCVQWTVGNESEEPLEENWIDAIYLISGNGDIVKLGEKLHFDTIQAGGECNATEWFDVPALAEGSWCVCLAVNAYCHVYEGTLTDNNVIVSDNLYPVAATVVPASDGAFSVPAGATAFLRISGLSTDGGILSFESDRIQDLAVSRAFPSAEWPWTWRQDSESAGSLVIPPISAINSVYLFVRNEGNASAEISTSLATITPSLVAFSPSSLPAVKPAVLHLSGTALDRIRSVSLHDDDTVVATTYDVAHTSSTDAAATFDLSDLDPDCGYRVSAIIDGDRIFADDSFCVTAPAATPDDKDPLEAWLDLPDFVRDDRVFTGYIHYRNTGATDMTVPVFKISATEDTTRLAEHPDDEFRAAPLMLVGASPTFPQNVLKAGEEASIPFYFTMHDQYYLILERLVANPEAIGSDYLPYFIEQWWKREQAKRSFEAQQAAAEALRQEMLPSLIEQYREAMFGPDTSTCDGYSIRGTASFEDGTAAAYESLSLYCASGEDGVLQEIITDENGEFVFQNLETGMEYFIRGVTVTVMSEDGIAIDGADVADVAIAVSPLGSILGVVCNAADPNQVYAGLTVFVQDGYKFVQETVTDENGAYAFRGLHFGDIAIQTDVTDGMAFGYAETQLNVDNLIAKVDLALVPGVDITGTLLADGTTRPVTNVMLNLHDSETLLWTGTAISDDNGRFEFKAVPASSTALVSVAESGWRLADASTNLFIGAESLETTLFVIEPPLFHALPASGPVPLSVGFFLRDPDLADQGVTFAWDFDGDGQIDSDYADPLVQFTTPCTNDVTLVVTYANGLVVTSMVEACVTTYDPPPTVYQPGVLVLLDDDEANSGEWTIDSYDATNHYLRLTATSPSPALTPVEGTPVVFKDENDRFRWQRVTSVSADGSSWTLVITNVDDLAEIYDSFEYFVSPFDNPESSSSDPSLVRRDGKDMLGSIRHIDNGLGGQMDDMQSSPGGTRMARNPRDYSNAARAAGSSRVDQGQTKTTLSGQETLSYKLNFSKEVGWGNRFEKAFEVRDDSGRFTLRGKLELAGYAMMYGDFSLDFAQTMYYRLDNDVQQIRLDDPIVTSSYDWGGKAGAYSKLTAEVSGNIVKNDYVNIDVRAWASLEQSIEGGIGKGGSYLDQKSSVSFGGDIVFNLGSEGQKVANYANQKVDETRTFLSDVKNEEEEKIKQTLGQGVPEETANKFGEIYDETIGECGQKVDEYKNNFLQKSNDLQQKFQQAGNDIRQNVNNAQQNLQQGFNNFQQNLQQGFNNFQQNFQQGGGQRAKNNVSQSSANNRLQRADGTRVPARGSDEEADMPDNLLTVLRSATDDSVHKLSNGMPAFSQGVRRQMDVLVSRTVDYGDGTVETFTAGLSPQGSPDSETQREASAGISDQIIHAYTSHGRYTVTIQDHYEHSSPPPQRFVVEVEDLDLGNFHFPTPLLYEALPLLGPNFQVGVSDPWATNAVTPLSAAFCLIVGIPPDPSIYGSANANPNSRAYPRGGSSQDTDGDGISDMDELQTCSNPTNPDDPQNKPPLGPTTNAPTPGGPGGPGGGGGGGGGGASGGPGGGDGPGGGGGPGGGDGPGGGGGPGGPGGTNSGNLKKCKTWKTAIFRYSAICKDGILQSVSSFVRFGHATDCQKTGTTLNDVTALLTGGDGGFSAGGGGMEIGWGRIPTWNPCGKIKWPPDPGDPTPRGDPGKDPGGSAVYLPTGDYIDSSLDLPLRMGGTKAGVDRELKDNEWTFQEVASGLKLSPGEGKEGEIPVGTGTLGVEWNGSGAPGAVPVLTNAATSVSLSSVPTGLWGPWCGSTQALIRVVYGLLRGNGTVVTNYGELVTAWRAAVQGGDTGTAVELESAAMEGMVRVTAAVDAEGRRTSYEWNGQGQMTVAHFADGTQESYEYGNGGMMSGKTKRDGEHVGLVHDNYGYLTGLNDKKYEYTFDAGTKTFYAAIRYPDGRVGERWFDEDGKIFRHAMNGGLVYDKEAVKADALLATKPAWPKETLNDAELPMSVEYRSGATETFTWDGPGYARTSAKEATGEAQAWTYDGAGREMSETRAGVAVSVERDEAGYVTREHLNSASGTEEAGWTWDAAGNASEGRMGDWARTNTYDLAGRVLSATAADGGRWTFSRDAEGRITGWTQPDGESGAKAYDGRGRMTWRRSPGGVETWWHHATNGLLTGWSNSLGRQVSYQYDKGERVAKATDESGDIVLYEYDGAGNWRGLAPELRTFINDGEGGLALSVTNGNSVVLARRLWGAWQLRDIQANDQSWRLERNDEGQVTSLVRAPVAVAATTNHWTYDAAGRLTGWKDATDVSVSRGYDAAGFVAWETNGAGGVRRWAHDGMGRLTEVTDAAGRTSVFAHTPATGTTTATLSDGSQIERRSDAWGREIGQTDAAGTEIATERRFDGAVLKKTWTAAGAESAALEATWTCDGDGQLVRQGRTGGLATRIERTGSNRCERTVTEYGTFEAGVAVERDASGRLSAVQGPDDARAECVYGDDGEVSGWLLPEGSVWFTRKLMDRTRTMMLPAGQLVTEHVDLAGHTTNVALSGVDGTVVWSLTLVRDAAGRIVRQGTETLEWDGAERMVSAGGTAYARDAAGNRSGSGWTTEGMDRLTAWPDGTYGYDTNGAVVSRTSGASELRFVRDLEGRVEEIRDGTDGLVARFAYDADGHRLSKEIGDGTQTWYLWSGDRLAAELSGDGTIDRVYGYWTEEVRSPDWVRTGEELYVVLKDGFDAPAALVSGSDGSVTETTLGTVFGEGWACEPMPVWADGLIADAETGLMVGSDGRLYDPATGRWLSPTPGALEAAVNLYAREPSAVGVDREFPGLSMPGVSPEYDVTYAFARRCGADAATASTLARAELLLDLEARSDATARRWVRLRDEATTAAGLRLLGGVSADQVVCARKGVKSFLKARREVLGVTDELDAYGKLRSAMDLEEAFRLELAWSDAAEDRAEMGAWRGTWGWAGLRPEGPCAVKRWQKLLLKAGNGERLSEEELEWLGEAKLLALSDWVRPVTASLDAEKMRETVGEDMTELRQVLQMWVKECK